MPEDYVSGRDVFSLVMAIDTKVTTLVAEAEYLAKRAEEDREAVERFAEELETLRSRFYLLIVVAVLVSAGIAKWSDLLGLLTK
jgi:hypothetical protein